MDKLTAKERESLEENDEKEEKEKEVEVGNGEKGQQEDQGEEKEVKVEEEEVEGVMLEEDDLEELKSHVLQLVLELEEAREVSQQHEESFMEIQGELLFVSVSVCVSEEFVSECDCICVSVWNCVCLSE